MNFAQSIAADLKAHLELYQEILAVVSRENELLAALEARQDAALHSRKKEMLSRLNDSLDKLRRHRLSWAAVSPSDRAANPEIASLLRQSQDLIMKIIVLDRENEQSLLRRGLMPARHVPSANRQRPHFVANLYQRGGGS